MAVFVEASPGGAQRGGRRIFQAKGNPAQDVPEDGIRLGHICVTQANRSFLGSDSIGGLLFVSIFVYLHDELMSV